jgi:tetratricopeptide (TPR) repeat protein
MEAILVWFVVFFAGLTIYRLLSQRAATPKARVAAMLRRYHLMARTGLAEAECLFRIMATRSAWKHLPYDFLRELVRRLTTKEDVMRFISLAEDCGYVKERFPVIAGHDDLNDAMAEVACLLARFGYQLQEQGRLKEAEFVQKLALPLGPDRYYTNLPLAATYYAAGRYTEARPLFERGLAQLQEFVSTANDNRQPFPPSVCLGTEIDATQLRANYLGKYEACLRAPGAHRQ